MGRNHNALIFELALLLKLRLVQGVAIDLQQAFAAWWARAGKYCPLTRGQDFYWMELQHAMQCTRGGVLAQAWRASEGVTPPGAQRLMSPYLRRLAGLCFALQQARGGANFVLPYRTCAMVFAPFCPGCGRMDAFEWFRVLQFNGLVVKTLVGNVGKGNHGSGTANEWQYVGR
jgi:hypothetical protein